MRLEVTQAFIELRTGPGKPYPIFYVAERGNTIEIQKRRNDWYKIALITNQRDKIGWVHRKAIIDMPIANSGFEARQLPAKDHARLKAALNPKIYLGFNYGQSSSSDATGVYAGYAINPTLALEIQANEIIGQDLEEVSWSANLSFTPFNKWKIAPFAQIGAGGIDTESRGTASEQNNGSDKIFQSTGGIGILLSKRYRLRFEYRNLNILQSKNQNRDIESWQAGFIGYF